MLAAIAVRPKIADAPLSVILLARSGVADCEAVAREWLAWLDQRPGNSEVLLVLDDPTVVAPINDPRCRVLHHIAPSGVGAALQSAIVLARFPLLLTVPCDRQFQPAAAQHLFEPIDQVDLVAGCRVHRPPPWWLRGLGLVQRMVTLILLGYADEPRPSWLGWHGWGRRWVARHIFGVKLRDPECPFRLFRAETLRRFPIQSVGSFVWEEVVAKANHLGCLLAEAPVPWTPLTEEVDATWSADAKRLRRQPEFGPPLPPIPTGVATNDVLASNHAAISDNPSMPDQVGGDAAADRA